MQLNSTNNLNNDLDEPTFDDLMANLCVLITHHSLTQCNNALPRIVEQIHLLTHHADMECYPNQLKVLLKMQTLWRTKLFRNQVSQLKH